MTKTVLITGASSGIGRATALRLAGQGHRVLATARREDRLHQLAADVPGGEIVPLRLDVRDQRGIAALPSTLASHAPDGLDVLINSAGYAAAGPVETLSSEALRAQFETNLFGLLDVTRALLPDMRARRRGRIINVSSVVGRVTFPGMGVYGATKYALEAISDALRMELTGFGIQVVLVEPAFVATEIATASTQAAEAFPGELSDYEDMHQTVLDYVEQQVKSGVKPELVAGVIARAATAPRPRPRYVVPRSGRVLIGALGSLPTRLADSGKLRQMASR